MQHHEMTVDDLIKIIRRRKWSLILPAFVILLTATIIALALPPVYNSTAKILIEAQDIPADFVRATVSSYAEQRLATINQRITSSTILLGIIDKLGLYEDLRGEKPTEAIVAKMRKNISLQQIGANVIDPRSGKPSQVTIAFTLSFDGDSPEEVQRVTGMLTSFFMEENLQIRERQTRETSGFLEDEMAKINIDLATQESAIAAFKEEHMDELPSLLQFNLQSLNTIELKTERLSEDLRSLKEREDYLQSQLAAVSPEMGDNRLVALKMQLTQLRTVYSDEYPDVIKTRAEISQLEKQLNAKGAAAASVGGRPENPEYQTLTSQLATVGMQINSTGRQINELEKKADDYRRRIEATPKIEENYRALLTQRDTTLGKYNDLMRKLMEARVAYGLEKEQKGERFTLIEPAVLPQKPYKPNRLVIMLLGLVLGAGVGVGIVCLREYADQSIYEADSLARDTSFPVLVSIPVIRTQREIIRHRLKILTLFMVVAIIVSAALVFCHYKIMDLNILGNIIKERLMP